jgi:hypothetical protein
MLFPRRLKVLTDRRTTLAYTHARPDGSLHLLLEALEPEPIRVVVDVAAAGYLTRLEAMAPGGRRVALGEAGLADRSSRPHRMPRRTSAETTAPIVSARREHHAGPMRLAAILGLAASTIDAVLARAGMPRPADVDRLTGELLRGRRHSDRRYGRVPDGGGWRIHGRSEQVRGRGNGWDLCARRHR